MLNFEEPDVVIGNYITDAIELFKRRDTRGFIDTDEITRYMAEDCIRHSGNGSPTGEIYHQAALLGFRIKFRSQYEAMNRMNFGGINKGTVTAVKDDSGRSRYITDDHVGLNQAREKAERHRKTADTHTTSRKKFEAYESFMVSQDCVEMQTALANANMSFEDFATGVAL